MSNYPLIPENNGARVVFAGEPVIAYLINASLEAVNVGWFAKGVCNNRQKLLPAGETLRIPFAVEDKDVKDFELTVMEYASCSVQKFPFKVLEVADVELL
jgi:hypothetical protein